MLRDIADETPILNQLLIDSGMIWCFLHQRPESLSCWLDENPLNVPIKVGVEWTMPMDTIEFRMHQRVLAQAKVHSPERDTMSIIKGLTS